MDAYRSDPVKFIYTSAKRKLDLFLVFDKFNILRLIIFGDLKPNFIPVTGIFSVCEVVIVDYSIDDTFISLQFIYIPLNRLILKSNSHVRKELCYFVIEVKTVARPMFVLQFCCIAG